MPYRFTAAAFLLSTVLVSADDVRTVQVKAQGHAQVIPDEVYVGLMVDVTEASLVEAKQKNDKITAAIVALAPKYKIAIGDVEVTNMQVEPNYDNSGMFSGRAYGGKIVLYDFKRSLNMRLVDFRQIEPLLTDAFDAGLTNVQYLSFRVSDQRKHQFSARERAVTNATEKATHLVQLTGMKLGFPTSIIEDVEYSWGAGGGFGASGHFSSAANSVGRSDYIRVAFKDEAAVGHQADAKLFAPGNVTISATVQIVFEMSRP